MLAYNRFSRDLVHEINRTVRDKRQRRQKLNQLYQKFGASEVLFNGNCVGWKVNGEFVCFKRSFRTEADALLILGLSHSKRGYKCKEVYQCPKCNQWHATSKGHLAGSYK